MLPSLHASSKNMTSLFVHIYVLPFCITSNSIYSWVKTYFESGLNSGLSKTQNQYGIQNTEHRIWNFVYNGVSLIAQAAADK